MAIYVFKDQSGLAEAWSNAFDIYRDKGTTEDGTKLVYRSHIILLCNAMDSIAGCSGGG